MLVSNTDRSHLEGSWKVQAEMQGQMKVKMTMQNGCTMGQSAPLQLSLVFHLNLQQQIFVRAENLIKSAGGLISLHCYDLLGGS